jgi:PAS domain S-box-containing protein
VTAAGPGELAEVREQLREAQETIEAIRRGGVDALIIGAPGHEQIYAVASSDRTYQLLVEAMNEGAAVASPRGVILDANPRLASMTGRAITDLVGTAVVDLIPAAHRRAFARLFDLGQGSSGVRGEVELTGPDRTTVPVLLAVSGFDLEGMLLRCLVMTDLTAQRRAEAEVRALNTELEARVKRRTAELERANKNLEAFSYSVSHDLRTPLRAVCGFSEALLEEYGDRLDETGHGYLRRIAAATERMGALIDDLLLLSRVSRTEMNMESVDLSAEVADVAAELCASEPGRQVRFRVQEGVYVTADRSLIRSVVQNLVENAWKFTSKRADAIIEFATTADDDAAVCCHIRDNGAGFDRAYVGKLFQPFQRLHTGTEFPGTGIGLASVQRIIERHGGRVWADGAPGEGAVFYFTLDASEGA